MCFFKFAAKVQHFLEIRKKKWIFVGLRLANGLKTTIKPRLNHDKTIEQKQPMDEKLYIFLKIFAHSNYL